MINFLEEAISIKEELIAWRRDFHENPELGFEEVRTSRVIKEFLNKEGIPFVEAAKTGIVATIKGGKEGKTIALRADIDALPIQDKKTCEYSSKVQGKMHACGHDAHTTILLGAAKLLNKHKESLNGNVKLLFEPAEETIGGAPFMIKAGALENPHVDAIIGLHVNESLRAGEIKVKKGVVNAASNPFTIKVKGKGGHGAEPHNTVDPIVIASHLVLALQPLVSREISPVNPAVVTVGSINGGFAQNVIPDEVELKGIIRTMTKEDRAYAVKRIEEISKGIASTFRGDCTIEVEESYPCLYNNDDMVDIVRTSAETIIGKENIYEQTAPFMGVESFAYFAMERNAAFYFLGVGNEEKGINKPIHNALFDIDENALQVGVAIQCQSAFNYLTRV
ncbi:M20 family metallopeptidase [Clostridium sp. YIM B02551]|uniref:M20 metallopeptidase family protein n=1 Tax=Clostridium sp. YIM B02551 TaxID=2910679 RepID=UPI001EEA1BD0|nr:amidohydrolase [Clostridium sp. YIM B02551]